MNKHGFKQYFEGDNGLYEVTGNDHVFGGYYPADQVDAKIHALESLIAPAKAAAEYLDSNFKGNKFYTRAMDIEANLRTALEKCDES